MQPQKGMTLIGMLFTLALVVSVGVTIMKIIPVYIEHYAVTQALEAIQIIPRNECSTESTMNVAYIRSAILKHLEINDMNDVTEHQISIEPMDNGSYQVTIQYNVERPWFADISLLFHFKNTVGAHCAQS